MTVVTYSNNNIMETARKNNISVFYVKKLFRKLKVDKIIQFLLKN